MKHVYYCIVFFLFAACKEEPVNTFTDALEKNQQEIVAYINDNNLEAQQTASGLYYIIDHPVNNLSDSGSLATIKYEISLLNNNSVDSTYHLNQDETYSFPLFGNTFLRGIEEGVALMQTGDVATFLMPFTLAFGSSSTPDLPPFSAIKARVELIDLQTEIERITDFFVENNIIDPTEIEEGLYQYSLNENDLPDNALYIEDNDTVTLSYEGRFLDGKLFDHSDNFILSGDGFVFQNNTKSNSKVISGWINGLREAKENEKLFLIMTSDKAYGAKGSGKTIPPYEPLVFEIEIKSIRKGENE